MSREPFTITATLIEHVRDPDCDGHNRPCEDCDDFCTIDESNNADKGKHDLYDAFGTFECQGDHYECLTTRWAVYADVLVGERFVSFKGTGQRIGECIADIWQQAYDYAVVIAAKQISESGFDG